MKITSALIDRLIRLRDGDSLAASALNAQMLEELKADGVIALRAQGSRRTVAVIDPEAFVQSLDRIHEGLGNLEQMRALLGAELPSAARAAQVAATGNSKLVASRSFMGFLVNAYEPIECRLNGRDYTVDPAEGTATLIMDWRGFEIPADVVVVGVENAENFRCVSRQKWLFHEVLPGIRLLFVSRYPQQQSRDLREWLLSVHNAYVHFGDLDLAGINIYLTEFYAHLGCRASFLIPPDYEKRIQNGSALRYTSQYRRFRNMVVTDERVAMLVHCIHRHHKAYDQEGYIL